MPTTLKVSWHPSTFWARTKSAKFVSTSIGCCHSTEAGWNSYEITNWHKHCQGVDIVTNSKILDVVQDLVGDTVILRHSHFFAKLPGDGKRVSWHKTSYWPITPSKVVSAWLAIDDSLEDNAACVIPGSHLTENIPFRESSAEGNVSIKRCRMNCYQPSTLSPCVSTRAKCPCIAIGFCMVLKSISQTDVAVG